MVKAFGEILLRLSTFSGQLIGTSSTLEMHYGGSEVNVAASLAGMGHIVHMLTVLPDNDIGKSAQAELRKSGVSTQMLKVLPGRMGVYYLEQGSSVRSSKVIYDRLGSAFSNCHAEEWDWESLLVGGTWFHTSGITPGISQRVADATLEAVRQARRLGLKVSIDMNYRSNLWKYGKAPKDIMPAIVENADLVLGDPNTCDLMLGSKFANREYYNSPDELLVPFMAMQEVYPHLQYIAMTMREVKNTNSNTIGGTLYSDGATYESSPMEVSPIVERIGGGDAFMAGIIHSLLEDRPLEEVIQFATGASVLKMTVKGDVSPFSKEDIEAFINNKNKGKIQR